MKKNGTICYPVHSSQGAFDEHTLPNNALVFHCHVNWKDINYMLIFYVAPIWMDDANHIYIVCHPKSIKTAPRALVLPFLLS